MRLSFRKGLSFGLTSAIITTLGILVGLEAGTGQKSIVLSGILIVALADALSDAFGIHMSEESSDQPARAVWEATLATFLSKLVFALTFAVPVLLFSLSVAVVVGIAWGVLLLVLLSYRIARSERENPVRVITEHLVMTFGVIILTYGLGMAIRSFF